MRSSTKRLYSFLFSGVFLLAAFVIYVSLLSPEYGAVNALRGKLATKEDFLKKEQAVVNQVQGLLDKYEGAPLKETISLALPRDEGTAQIVNQILSVARNANIAVNSFSLGSAPLQVSAKAGAKSATPKVGTVNITINASGAYDAFKVFLQAIETNIRIMDISNLKILPRGDSFEYQLQVSTYYQTD